MNANQTKTHGKSVYLSILKIFSSGVELYQYQTICIEFVICDVHTTPTIILGLSLFKFKNLITQSYIVDSHRFSELTNNTSFVYRKKGN